MSVLSFFFCPVVRPELMDCIIIREQADECIMTVLPFQSFARKKNRGTLRKPTATCINIEKNCVRTLCKTCCM